MLTVSLLVSMVVVVQVVVAQTEVPLCGDGTTQRFNHTCPEKAVCADKWNTVRDWHNGTRCRERRVNFNCRCPGNLPCPVDNVNHHLYESKKQSMYLCESRCSLAMCNIATATNAEENPRTLQGIRYFKVNCRCPGHNIPLELEPGSQLSPNAVVNNGRIGNIVRRKCAEIPYITPVENCCKRQKNCFDDFI